MERTESKLFNNNLYGKLAMSDNSSYMKPYLLDEVVHYELVEEHKRDVFSIPCGSICTAAARYYTITHAQDNYEYFVMLIQIPSILRKEIIRILL